MKIVPSLVSMRKGEGQMEHEAEMAMGKPKLDEYPHGLCIHLMKDEIDALGLAELPDPGDTFKILAQGIVTASSMKPSGADPMLTIQLVALQLVSEDEEIEEPKESQTKSQRARTVLGNMYRSYE